MTARDDDILADLFHSCAFAAFLEQTTFVQGWPDPEPTSSHPRTGIARDN
jgi:hypothetical protein